MAIPLLKTKLYVSPLRAGLVSRPRLIERLNAGLARKLTLVSAPAGFGKTTVIGEWIHHNHLRAAWVSLDENDDDPMRFWAYVIAALQSIDPAVGRSLSGALGSPQPPPLNILTTVLINELVEAGGREPHPLVLVLDDYHAVAAPEIHASIDTFLDHLPPGVHLVITTRQDPPLSLSRLRGRGQITEMGAADLRFTASESAQLLHAVAGLELAAEDVTLLADRTEGWAVGLQMAALSLQRETRSNQRAFVRAFAGDDRLVADYLADEVLGRQAPHIQRFLLQTSLLERLCGPLCDALTGRDDSQHILRELERTNLFVVPLDQRRTWYRYHGLFADLLRERLREQNPDLSVLHRRASEWWASQGFWEEAISHALQADDPERAADLVAESILATILRGEFVLAQRWLDALAEELVRARPILCIARAWCVLPHSIERAQDWIQVAEQHVLDGLGQATGDLDQAVGDLVVAHAATLRISIARMVQAPPARIVELCQRALGQIHDGHTELRALVAFWMGHASQELGDDSAADRAFELVMQMDRDSKSHTIALVMNGLRAWTNLDQGRLHDAAALCRQMLQTIVEPAERTGERLPMACYVYIVLGQVHLQWNERQAAVHYLERGIELAELTTIERPILIDGYCALARLRSIEGRFEQALTLMDQAEQTMLLWQGQAGYTPALRARIWLARARVERDPRFLDTAIAWADAHPLQPDETYNPELGSWARVRIAQRRAYGAPDLDSLLSLLDDQSRRAQECGRAQEHGRVGWQIEMLALQALARHAQGQTDAAADALERALLLARPERFTIELLEHGAPMGALLEQVIRRESVREYARELLAASEEALQDETGERTAPSAPTPARSVELVEPLTPRELEVLALIAAGASNPEIARDLYISVNTVKRHVTNIFGKLEVSSRTQAVARGRELGLVD